MWIGGEEKRVGRGKGGVGVEKEVIWGLCARQIAIWIWTKAGGASKREGKEQGSNQRMG